MKIAIVTYSLHVGGVERFIFNFAKYFLNKHHIVHVIEEEKAGEWKKYFIENGIKVITHPINLFTIPWLHSWFMGIELNNYDIILLIDVPFSQASLGKLDENKICFPIIELSIPSFYVNATNNSGQWNHIVAVSNQIEEILITQHRISQSQIKTIPNSINIGDYPERTFNIEDSIKFIYVGRIENKQKGVFLLPDIIKNILNVYPKSELTIIGDGPDLKDLKIMTESYNLANRIIFKGFMSNEKILEILKNYHFLLMPSNQEGLPFVLLEAMSQGVIPIVSNLPGITDMVVQEGFNGYFAEPGDSSTFVKAAIKAIEKADEMRIISRNAYQTVLNKFSTEKMGEEYENLIEISMNKRTIRNNKVDLKSLGYKFPYLPIVIGKILNKMRRLMK